MVLVVSVLILLGGLEPASGETAGASPIDPMDDGTIGGRKAVMGALALYLDFINLFLSLLRLFGDRR